MKKIKIIFCFINIFFLLALFSFANNIEDYYEKGLTLLKSGNNEQSILEFKRAITDNPLLSDAYYGLGIIYLLEGQLEKSRLYFNKGVSIDQRFDSLNLKAEELLINCLKPYGFSEDELQEKFLNSQDIQYISRCFIYKEIADNISKNQKLSVKKKAEILFNWTVRNIAQDADRKDFAVLPIDVMVRGYGCCDRSAWVLVTLSRQVGIKGNIFYLIDPLGKTSPHTIALLYIDNKWCVFDPYKEIIFKNPKDNSLIGIDEVLKNPSLIEQFYPKDTSFYKAFEEGIFWIPGESRGYFPKMEIIEKIIHELTRKTPHIYWNLTEEVDFAVKTFLNSNLSSKTIFRETFFQIEDKKVKVGIWFYPFRLEQYYFSGKFLANIEANLPYFFLYKEERLDYLQGKYEKAVQQLDKLIRVSPSKDFREDIYYFQAPTYFEKGDRDKILSLCNKYLKEYPKGRWTDRVEKLMSN